MKAQRIRDSLENSFWFVFVGIPVAIVFAPLVALMVLHGLFCMFVVSIRTRVQMRRQRRTLDKAALTQKLQINAGTLIIESTPFSFGWDRAWWTEDDVLAICPVQPPEHKCAEEKSREDRIAEYKFTSWVDANYTNLQTGRAKLVKASGGEGFVKKLSGLFPALKQVVVWTGALDILQAEIEDDGARDDGLLDDLK